MRKQAILAPMLCFLLALSAMMPRAAEDFTSPVVEPAQDTPDEELFIPAPEFPAPEETDLVFADSGFFEDVTPTPPPTATPKPTKAPPARTQSFVPAIDSVADGFKVEGLDTAFSFPLDAQIDFTVTGASAAVRYGDNLYAQDGMWIPSYWVIDGDEEHRDPLSDTSDPQRTRTMHLTSDKTQDHTPGTHFFQVYFSLYTWNGSAWEPASGGSEVKPVLVSYTVDKSGAVTPTPVPELTASARLGYLPTVDSREDGFSITGLENPLPMAEGVSHAFTVTGASAVSKHGEHLVAGDGKFSPIYWTGSPEEAPNPEEDWTLTDTKEMSIKSAEGLYGPSRNLIIYVHFRLYIYDGSNWNPTSTVETVPVTVVTADITATPTPTPIPVPSGAVTLNADTVTLYKNGAKAYKKFNLKATLTGDCEGKTVSYSSSKASVAKVSKKGVITAKKKGTTKITAKVKVGTATFKAVCTVKVNNPTLTLTQDTISLQVGQQGSISALAIPQAALDFSSTDKSVATVTRKGLISAKKAGTCEIVVTANKVSKRCKVTVKDMQ